MEAQALCRERERERERLLVQCNHRNLDSIIMLCMRSQLWLELRKFSEHRSIPTVFNELSCEERLSYNRGEYGTCVNSYVMDCIALRVTPIITRWLVIQLTVFRLTTFKS